MPGVDSVAETLRPFDANAGTLLIFLLVVVVYLGKGWVRPRLQHTAGYPPVAASLLLADPVLTCPRR
jgi:hypothetical protein